ncbi:MAG: helix-turn-helix transcriptional regulator [Clostridia bacterium]|nr:helix-turn-helix transcriptional regulator [Clostridia bacterium]
MRDGRNGYSTLPEIDFRPIGKAIKQAREARGVTREQLAEQLDYAPRHIQAIENEGQHPSFQLLAHLAMLFDVSVDQFLFPTRHQEASPARRQLDMQLDALDDRELMVVESTVLGLLRARQYAVKDTPQNK